MDRTPPTKDSLPTATNGHTVDIKGSQTTSEDDRTNGASIVTQQTSTLVGMPSPTKKSNLNGQGHPQPSRSSFLSRLFRMIVPCVFPSPAAHPIELPDTPHPITPLPQEKPPLKSPEIQHGVPEEVPKPESSKPTVDTLVQNVPATTESLEVVVPPTPTTPHLLPSEETEGMTSGAVQPPGSKGDSPTQEKSQHSPISENEESEYSEEDIEDPEDDEDRLIYNGGAGIPIGSDGVPRPLLPPIAPHHAGRKCLVLDLDETLVHSSFKSISQADYVVPVEIEFHWHNVYVIKRPGVDNFLKKMGEIYEVVVFTASLSKYADPVLDKLDIHQVVSHRLFRESCYNHKGNYVKDLSQLGRPIGDTIILDNSPASYIFHPNNAVPVSSWFNDPHDTELTDLVPFLADLSTVDDVRGVLDGAR